MNNVVGSRDHPFPAEIGAVGTGITNGTAERPFANAADFPFTEITITDTEFLGVGTAGTIENPFLITGEGKTPTVWTGSYSYITPPTATTPNMGEIVHGDNLLSQMLFSKTDLESTGYSGAPLAIGDVIDINGVRYTLDAVPRDMGAYYSVYIEPETQLQPAVYTVTVYAGGAQPRQPLLALTPDPQS